jgi:hypothetical protein
MPVSASALRRLTRSTRIAARSLALERQVVWILGSPRSGSTWLLNLLARVTGAAAIDEPLIGAHLATPIGAVTGLPSAQDELVVEASRDRADYFFAARHEAAWQRPLRALVLQRFAASCVEQGRGVRDLVVVKEPNGSLAAPMLVRTLPRSRLLFLVRDGRDVVDSTLDGVSGGWITESFGLRLDDVEARARFLATRAHQWVRIVDAVRAAYDQHDPALRYEVTYEALRAEPEAELTRILRWLGREDALPDLASSVDALSFEKLPAEAKGAGQFARAASPGLWRERFAAEEVAVLEEIMGPTLRQLGYEA